MNTVTEIVQTDSKSADNVNDDGRPSLMFHTHASKTVTVDDELYHLIISIREADVRKWCRDPENKNWWHKLDLYVEIIFENQPDSPLQTRKIYRSNGLAQFNWVKRCTYQQMKEMPTEVTFIVKKYRENRDDIFVGKKVYKLCEQMTFDKMHKQQSFICTESLKDEDGQDMCDNTLSLGMYYKYCSLMELKSQMAANMENCGGARLDPLIIKWVHDNKKLLKKLKANEGLGVQITDQDFSDLNFPAFELMDGDAKLYAFVPFLVNIVYIINRGFLRSLHTIQNVYGMRAMSNKKYYSKWKKHKRHKYHRGKHDDAKDDDDDDKDDANYQIYYDPDFDILYFSEVSSFYFGGENITKQVQLLFRYVYLKEVLLKGQDTEFNIYRSYYMDPSREKVAMGLLALMLQIILTAAISVDVFNDFTKDGLNPGHPLITAGAVMTFCFLTYSMFTMCTIT